MYLWFGSTIMAFVRFFSSGKRAVQICRIAQSVVVRGTFHGDVKYRRKHWFVPFILLYIRVILYLIVSEHRELFPIADLLLSMFFEPFDFLWVYLSIVNTFAVMQLFVDFVLSHSIKTCVHVVLRFSYWTLRA